MLIRMSAKRLHYKKDTKKIIAKRIITKGIIAKEIFEENCNEETHKCLEMMFLGIFMVFYPCYEIK